MSVIVLIVDDDEAVRFFHRVIVSQSKLSTEPLCFSNGKGVIEYLDQNSNETDSYLILLDINMPVMNGWDLLDIIKDKSYFTQVHIVIVTSTIDRDDYERSKLNSMIIDVVEKPISDEECKKIMNFSLIAGNFLNLKKI
ncbi:MAG: response regulator [Ferruginibacter sp.]|nr:response regulator [Ferruginibacter sp.]